MKLELFYGSSCVNINQILLLWTIIEEFFGVFCYFFFDFGRLSGALGTTGHFGLRLSVGGGFVDLTLRPLLIITIARAVHSFEFVGTGRGAIL